jgi:uncharacterized protein YkwD
LRRLGVVLLGVPVLGFVYAQTALRRSLALRLAALVAAAAALGVVGPALLGTADTTAHPSLRVAPLAPAAFTTSLRTGVGLGDEIEILFSDPMDEASVAGSIVVTPRIGLALTWRDDARTLVVRPATHWSAGTFYTLTVPAGAAASRAGAPLGVPGRAAFVTRPTGAVAVTLDPSTGSTPLEPALRVRSDSALDPEALRAALRVTPAVALSVESGVPRGEPADSFDVRPAGPLAAGTTYRVTIAPGLVDVDGARLRTGGGVSFRTPEAATVTRFRPQDGTKGVARDATLSVRFSQAMDRPATAAALVVAADGRPVALGTPHWAEGATVLVVTPASALAPGARVTMTVGAAARSATGVPLARSASAQFTVVAPPKPARKPTATSAPKPAPAAKPTPKPSTGDSVGAATWSAVESYYLRLMNCTRTGGWVTSSGSCSSPGGRNVAPLALSAGISAKVSRPYAKYLATHGACNHFLDGNPGDRLRRAGYTSYRWAENLGCRSGDPYAAVLGSHLYFQQEKFDSDPTDHYTNLMNALYDRAGIGVWVSSGRVRLVVDFYHP